MAIKVATTTSNRDGVDITIEYPITRPTPPRPVQTPLRPPPPAHTPTQPPPKPPQVPVYKPQPWVPPTTSADLVNEIADCLNKPPTDIDQNYILRSMHIAEYLQVPASNETSAQLSSNTKDLERLFTVKPVTNPNLSQTAPVIWVANEAGRAAANQAVANVLALIKRVEDFLARASSSGYVPPDNPFTVISTLNASRRGSWSKIGVDEALASDLIYSIKVVANLIDVENQGGINLKTGQVNSAQFSHVHLSFDGFGGSGNPAADILRFLSQADEIKKQTEEQALAVLDFRRRIPYVLFTLEYKPVHDTPPVGTLIGWKKIPDASGYIITRRDVFSQQELQFTVDNSTLSQLSTVLRDYVKTYATTFFNSMDDSSVITFLDASQTADEYYIYTVQAYQVRSEGQAATFSMQSTPVSLTAVSKSSIRQIINTIDPTFSATNVDTVSPWPAFSQFLYGTTNYDWILAAANTRASINRADTRADTRSYSYLNAQSTFLFAQSDAGKFVKPNDVNDVISRINDSIQKFGVQQTVQNMLDETGVSYYFEGRDAREDTHFDRAGTETVQTSNLFAVIGASIDPDTAVLDLQTLASNMSQLLNQNLLSTTTQVQPGSMPNADSHPTEISVPQPNEMSPEQADGPLQFISKLGDMRDPHADLTTFDGLSKLMRVIRILSDFGPNRVTPSSKTPAAVTPVVTAQVGAGSQANNPKPPITPTPIIRPLPTVFGGGGSGGGRGQNVAIKVN